MNDLKNLNETLNNCDCIYRELPKILEAKEDLDPAHCSSFYKENGTKLNLAKLFRVLERWKEQCSDNTNICINEWNRYSVANFLIEELQLHFTSDHKFVDQTFIPVCDQKGELIAMSKVRTSDTESSLEIDFLVASPNSKGGGSAAIRALMKKALKKNLSSITLFPLDAAIDFYKKQGFAPASSNTMYIIRANDMKRQLTQKVCPTTTH